MHRSLEASSYNMLLLLPTKVQISQSLVKVCSTSKMSARSFALSTWRGKLTQNVLQSFCTFESRGRIRCSRGFYSLALSFQAHVFAAKYRLLSTSGTTGAEGPSLKEGNGTKPETGMSSEGPAVVPISHIEKQRRVRSIFQSSAGNQWDECWKEGVTPWDVGGVTPIIQHLVDHSLVPNGRALVPGCGSGYDVLTLASESRQVLGLDISETANLRAKKNAAEDPRGKWVQFVVDDFFNFSPEAPFSFIFDYTFFCALDPTLRPNWAARMAELLAPNGELLTLMFPLDEFEGGPPFAVSVQAYEEVLNPVGLAMVSCEDNEFSLPRRKGREKVARWKKSSSKI